MNTQLKASELKDKWIYFFICPAIAFLSVHIGNENSLETLLKIPSYYSDLLLAFVCTYLTAYYIRLFFYKHFINSEWTKKEYLRLFLFGVLCPTLVILFIEALYLKFLLEIPLTNSSIFYLELPLVFTFCLLINLFYINLINGIQKSQLEKNFNIQKTINENVNRFLNFNFLVYSGSQSIVIRPTNVACIFVYEKNTFILTKDKKEYIYNSTLEKIENELDPMLFFRLNRKVIVQKNAIKSFERLETRKLKVTLIIEAKEPFFVSKSKAVKFQHWMLQK